MFSDLTPEAFLDALSKGKGRTVLALQNGNPSLYTDALLQGCVENLQFDRQIEENRAGYFMRLLNLAGLKERAREAILEALPKSEEGWDRDWMIDLLEALAKDGDTLARQALLDRARQGEERAQDALALVDDEGLQWVEQHLLPRLSFEERWRLNMWLPDEESDDQTPTQRRLRAIAKEDEAALSTPRSDRPARKVTAEPFLSSVRRGSSSITGASDFQRRANKRQKRMAARFFMRETNVRALRHLVRSLKKAPFPLPARKLFRHARHPERGGMVMAMLGTLDRPDVRRFALGLLRRRPLPWNALEALTSSLRPGDEPLILRVLQSTEGMSNTERHAPTIDVVGFLKDYPKGDWQANAEWIYEHSPCSGCRASAVLWMVEHGTVPGYIREEAIYDAESDPRELFEATRTDSESPLS